MNFPKLQTERLLLRELVPADASALFHIHGNAEAMRWFGSDPMQSLAEAERLVETFAAWRRLPNPGIRWGLERREDGELVGSCGLFNWNRAWCRCVLGYELAPAAQGLGLMAEALRAALGWGFLGRGHGPESRRGDDSSVQHALASLGQSLGFSPRGLAA